MTDKSKDTKIIEKVIKAKTEEIKENIAEIEQEIATEECNEPVEELTEDVQAKETKPKTKRGKKKKTLIKKCKIIWCRNNKVTFDFDGFKMSYKADKDLRKQAKKGFVNVKYIGEINNKDFEVIDVE